MRPSAFSLWKPILSAVIFFLTLMLCTIGYGALNGWISSADRVNTGSGLSASSWNRIIDGVLDLETKVSTYEARLTAIENKLSIGTITNPWLSCKDIKTKMPSLTDGAYYIKPDSGSAFQVYCDMTTDDGGWTLVSKTNGSDNNHVGVGSNALANLANTDTSTSWYIGDTYRKLLWNHYRLNTTNCSTKIYWYITNTLSFNEWWWAPNSWCKASEAYSSNPSTYSISCLDDAGSTGYTVWPAYNGRNFARPNWYVGNGVPNDSCPSSIYSKKALLFVK